MTAAMERLRDVSLFATAGSQAEAAAERAAVVLATEHPDPPPGDVDAARLRRVMQAGAELAAAVASLLGVDGAQ